MFLVSTIFTRKELFEKISWLDDVMHFFGGFFVGMFWSSLIPWPLVIIVLTLLMGVAWEIGEYFWGIYKFKKSGTKKYMIKMRDTIEDLFFDILGAVVWVLSLIGLNIGY